MLLPNFQYTSFELLKRGSNYHYSYNWHRNDTSTRKTRVIIDIRRNVTKTNCISTLFMDYFKTVIQLIAILVFSYLNNTS